MKKLKLFLNYIWTYKWYVYFIISTNLFLWFSCDYVINPFNITFSILCALALPFVIFVLQFIDL